MPATKARANALGFITPSGTDSPRAGDNAITANALLSAETRDLLTAATLDLQQVKANANTQTAATAATLNAFNNRIAALYTAASAPDANAAVAAVESRHWADESETSASTADGSASAAAGSASAAAGSASAAAGSASAAAGSATQASDSANAAASSATQASNSAKYEMRGAGRPSAAPAAGVGTYYTDTTGDGGVWRWLWNGTKWVPALGSTGARDLASILQSPFAPLTASSTVRAARDGNIVTFSAEVKANAATPAGATLLTLPDGFRPGFNQWVASATAPVIGLNIQGNGVVVVSTALSSGQTFRLGGVAYSTANDWPA